MEGWEKVLKLAYGLFVFAFAIFSKPSNVSSPVMLLIVLNVLEGSRVLKTGMIKSLLVANPPTTSTLKKK